MLNGEEGGGTGGRRDGRGGDGRGGVEAGGALEGRGVEPPTPRRGPATRRRRRRRRRRTACDPVFAGGYARAGGTVRALGSGATGGATIVGFWVDCCRNFSNY